jgi:hypothetical protein
LAAHLPLSSLLLLLWIEVAASETEHSMSTIFARERASNSA